MRRGFMLTAIAVVLFMILIDTAFEYAKSSSAFSESVSSMVVSERVNYIFDDITEDVTRIIGINITQQSSNLIIQDSVPAINITNNLAVYENFVRNYYLTPDIAIQFMNSTNQPISLNALSSNMSVNPFNLTYGYSNFTKNNMLIQIPLSQSGGVQLAWYNLSVTSGNFSNLSSISWSPTPVACFPSSTGCIKFYLVINDSSSNQYQSSVNYFNLTQSSGYLNVSFVNQSCWLELRLGNQYLLNLTNHGCKISSQIGFNFNNSNLQMYFPEKLSVLDAVYNTSKIDNINLISAHVVT